MAASHRATSRPSWLAPVTVQLAGWVAAAVIATVTVGALTAAPATKAVRPAPAPPPSTAGLTVSEMQRGLPTSDLPGFMTARDILDQLPMGGQVELVVVDSVLAQRDEAGALHEIGGYVNAEVSQWRIVISADWLAQPVAVMAQVIIHEYAHAAAAVTVQPEWVPEVYAVPAYAAGVAFVSPSEIAADCLAERLTGVLGGYATEGCTEAQLERALAALGLGDDWDLVLHIPTETADDRA